MRREYTLLDVEARVETAVLLTGALHKDWVTLNDAWEGGGQAELVGTISDTAIYLESFSEACGTAEVHNLYEALDWYTLVDYVANQFLSNVNNSSTRFKTLLELHYWLPHITNLYALRFYAIDHPHIPEAAKAAEAYKGWALKNLPGDVLREAGKWRE